MSLDLVWRNEGAILLSSCSARRRLKNKNLTNHQCTPSPTAGLLFKLRNKQTSNNRKQFVSVLLILFFHFGRAPPSVIGFMTLKIKADSLSTADRRKASSKVSHGMGAFVGGVAFEEGDARAVCNNS